MPERRDLNYSKTNRNNNKLVDIKTLRDSRAISPFPPQICILKGKIEEKVWGEKGERPRVRGRDEAKTRIVLERKQKKSKEEEGIDAGMVAAFLTITPGRANECSNYIWQLLCGRKAFFGVQMLRVRECSFSYEYGN